MPRVQSCLQAMAVVPEGPHRDALRAIFADAGWTLVFANSAASALARYRCEPIHIILYEREAEWRSAVSSFAHLSPRPCVILLSFSADQNLWDELVRYGGFDLLRLPLDPTATLRTLSAGRAIWRHQEITPLRTA